MIRTETKCCTVMYFSSPWCGVCRFAESSVQSAVKQFPGVKFVKADLQENPQIGNKYKVSTVPTIIVENGKSQKRLFGAQRQEAIEEAIRDVLD